MVGYSYGGSSGASYGGPNGSRYGTPRPRRVEALTVDQGADADSELSLSWDAAGSAEEYAILRDESSGETANDYDEIDTTTDTGYTDTGLTNGRTYHYRVVARNAVGDAEPSNEVNETTALPSPTITNLGNGERGEIVVEWGIEDDNPDGDVAIKRDDDPLTTVDDLSETSFVDGDNVLDGDQYEYLVERDTGDATAIDDDTVVAFLPDVQELALDNGIVDEIEVSWDPDSINNGEFEIEFEDDEDPGFKTHATLNESESSTVIDQLLDGQQYNVRVRATTEFATTDWVTNDIVTKFPAVTDVEVTSTTETTATVEWTDNSDNERGQLVLRQQRVDGEWWPPRNVGDTGPDQESFVDESVQPNRTYRYLIGTFTNYANTESDPSEAADTAEVDVPDDTAPSVGWRVEADRPDDGTFVVGLLDDPTAEPTVNGYPSLRVAADPDEFWQKDAWNDAPVRAWLNGDRLPIDVLEHRDLTPERTDLEARGGTQLDKRVVARSDAVEPVAEFVERLINEHTDYKSVVDDVDEQIREGVLIQFGTSNAELQTALDDIPDDVPATVKDDELLPTRIGFVELASSNDAEDDEYVGGTAQNWVAGTRSQPSVDVELEHEVPEGAGVVVVRADRAGQDAVDVNVQLDGEQVSISDIIFSGLGWTAFPIDVDVKPGSHTFDVEAVDGNGSSLGFFDVTTFVDTRYISSDPSDFDNEVDEPGGNLNDPPLYPERDAPVDVELQSIETPLSVASATLSVESDDSEPLPALALREDGVGDYLEESDTLKITVDYEELEATVQGRVFLGVRNNLDPRDKTPRQGYEPQGLDSLDLRADIDETPVLVNRTFDKKLVDVLRECMEVYDGAFEVRGHDPVELHVARIDGRPVDVDPELVDFSVDKNTEDSAGRAIVYAAAQSIRRLPFEATEGEWEALPLGEGRIVEGSESIFDADDEDSRLEKGDDYEIREVVEDGPPEIRLTSSVSDPRIDCDFKPRGEHTAADADNSPKEFITDAPELNSQQMADLAAFQAVEGSYADQVIDATVTIPVGEVGFNVLDALNVAGLPGDRPYQVNDTTSGPDTIDVRLGAGVTIGEAIQQIRDRAGRVSERV